MTPRCIDGLVDCSDDLRHGNVVGQPRKAKPAAWSAHALEPVIPQSRKQLLEVLRRDFLPYADVRHGHRIVSPAERQIQHGCNGVASTRREPHCKPKVGEYSSLLVSYLEEKFKSRDPMPCDKVDSVCASMRCAGHTERDSNFGRCRVAWYGEAYDVARHAAQARWIKLLALIRSVSAKKLGEGAVGHRDYCSKWNSV